MIHLPREPRKILIVKPSALGDVVHTLPILRLLRRRFPALDVLLFTVRVQGSGAAEEIAAAIRSRNPQAEVRFVNTICHPTLERQAAITELCAHVDAVVVVGGENSNNTRQLVRLARELGRPAWQVENAGQLNPAWFEGCRCVGLTAGTSTLDETVDEVHAALAAIPIARSDRPSGPLQEAQFAGDIQSNGRRS